MLRFIQLVGIFLGWIIVQFIVIQLFVRFVFVKRKLLRFQ